MGSKTSIQGTVGKNEDASGFKAVRETSLLRIEKVKGCMFVNQYLVVKYLGRGACGKVFLCLNVHDSRLYAMKAVRKADLQTSRNQANKRNPMDDLKREIMIMKKMKHLNIVTLSEVIDDPTGSKLLLVMEYLEGGPVMTREALERCERLPESLVSKYFRDMVRVRSLFRPVLHEVRCDDVTGLGTRLSAQSESCPWRSQARECVGIC